MSANPWMPLYIADYVADTMHLSTLEHGAYFLLILAYWQRQEPLPADPAKLSMICKLSRRDWDAIAPTIAEFFEVTEATWRHHRIDREIATARSKYERRAAAGRKGGQAKATAANTVMQEHSSSIARPLPEQCTSDDVAGLYQPQPHIQSSLRSDSIAAAADVRARTEAVADDFVREPHVDIAVSIGNMIRERWPEAIWLPGDAGRIKTWLAGGWSRETIEQAVASKIQRMDKPPHAFKFFEAHIADLVASMNAPLPSGGSDRVATPSTSRLSGHSNLTAALARLAAQGGG